MQPEYSRWLAEGRVQLSYAMLSKRSFQQMGKADWVMNRHILESVGIFFAVSIYLDLGLLDPG